MDLHELQEQIDASNKVPQHLYMVLFGDNTDNAWAFYLPWETEDLNHGQLNYVDGQKTRDEPPQWQTRLFHLDIKLKASGEDVEPDYEALSPVDIDEDEKTFLAPVGLKVSYDCLWEAARFVFTEASRPGIAPTKRHFCRDVAVWLEEKYPGSIDADTMETIKNPAQYRELPGVIRRKYDFDDTDCYPRLHGTNS